MKASLKIEAIGDDLLQQLRFERHKLRVMLGAKLAHQVIDGIPSRAWCAEIIGPHPRYGYERRFLRGKKDYATANSTGSRGIFIYYILESGHVYEVSSPQSWHSDDRYFCRVDAAGAIIRMSKDEVDQWLTNGAFRSGLTS